MTRTLIASFKDRDEAHAKLAQVLEAGTHPWACCIEDFTKNEPYEVWNDNQEKPR